MLPRHLHTTLIAGIITGLFASAALAPPAHARKRARAPKAESSKRPEKAPKPAAPSSDVAPVETERAATPAAAATPSTPAPAPKPRVYTFSGLDVNGNLKAPQLLFFRGRVKQELDTSNPEKRSFLKELERTADAEGL